LTISPKDIFYGVSRLIFKDGLGKAAVEDLLGAWLDFERLTIDVRLESGK
jgi:hypothetical protein